ncbi:Protein of unknown function [Bacillus wiedmannii]|uniref:Uncharacterized protein n=1 Tax=Bacillus wiedmannii TaxID=1890302 RepID=A0AB37Z1X6_9BACI|nr:Protein of unknown function [Bacillus wiedmannii]
MNRNDWQSMHLGQIIFSFPIAIMKMIMSVCRLHHKIIIACNLHKSILLVIIFTGAKVVFVKQFF